MWGEAGLGRALDSASMTETEALWGPQRPPEPLVWAGEQQSALRTTGGPVQLRRAQPGQPERTCRSEAKGLVVGF